MIDEWASWEPQNLALALDDGCNGDKKCSWHTFPFHGVVVLSLLDPSARTIRTSGNGESDLQNVDGSISDVGRISQVFAFQYKHWMGEYRTLKLLK
jgi:hypothetical protein